MTTAVESASNGLSVTPLAGLIGAEVETELAALDDATFAQVREAFLEHVVLVFNRETREAAIEALKARGVLLHQYLPDQAFTATLPAPTEQELRQTFSRWKSQRVVRHLFYTNPDSAAATDSAPLVR